METNESSRSLRDWLYLLFRHKFKILGVFFTVVFAVAIMSFTTPRTYRASTKILVKFGWENVYTPHGPQSSAQQAVVDPSKEERLNSEIEIIRARGLIEKVIGSIGVKTLYPNIDAPSTFGFMNSRSPRITPQERATIQFQNALRVQGIKKSNIIQVDFDHGNPEVAARTLRTIIDVFIDQHVVAYKQLQDHGFFNKQTEALKRALSTSEAKLQDFRTRHDISTVQEQKNVLLRQISDVELGLARTRAEISENRGRKESMEYAVSSSSSAAPKFGKETDLNTAAISSIKNKITDLKLREQELVAKYSEKNYLVVAIRKEIGEAERLLAVEERTYHDKEVRSLGHTVTALTEREAAQARHLARYKAEIYRISSLENQLRDLERQARIDEENYRLYVQKAEEARISEVMDNRKIANISIVEPPLVPIGPIKPNIRLNILIAIVLGACAGLGLAYCLDYASHGFKTEEDVKKRLGLPVLASLPKVKA